MRRQILPSSGVAAGFLVVALSGVGAQQTAQVPPFRATVTLVPVDVRVLDRSGNPVTDLRQEDFTVLEDSEPQVIRHFRVQSFSPAQSPPAAGVTAPGGTGGSAASAGLPIRRSPLSLAPQVHRVFLIVLGLGRLQEPSKGLAAAARFVRTQLLPQDQVAVFAYNRATDFTTNHERVAQIIERFSRENDALNAEMRQQLSGLAAVYGSRVLAPAVQARIDGVFAPGASTLGVRDVQPAENARTGSRTRLDVDRAIENRIDAAVRSSAVGAQSLDAADLASPPVDLLPFDGFVETTMQTMRDLGNLYGAIGFLRRRDGEKHIVFVTETGLALPRTEDDIDLARVASDARVVLDTVQTGGTYRADYWAGQALRTLSELTGGVASVSQYATVAFDRIDTVTRSGYLLGYYPTNATWDGAFRRIDIKVNRPDVTVLFRHGYFARQDIPTFDRRAYITEHRLMAAARHRRTIPDIRIRLKASLDKAGDGYQISIEARIGPSNLSFTVENGVRVGRIDIAVVGVGEKGVILAEASQTVNLRLADDVFQRVLKDGIPYKARLPAPAATQVVRVVVHDYWAELVGSAEARVR